MAPTDVWVMEPTQGPTLTLISCYPYMVSTERIVVFADLVESGRIEQTGALDEMLTKIADFYDEEVDAAVEALLSAMEPIMIVVLGVVVGGMIVAMYLPIFDMINAVQG